MCSEFHWYQQLLVVSSCENDNEIRVSKTDAVFLKHTCLSNCQLVT
jgi:hypothetical protein